MLRLQTAQLPATALAFKARLRFELCAKRESSFFCVTAKLFCRNEIMLPLGKHFHFAVRRSRR